MTAREPFRWPVRVYYEDTDAGGVVYYANYLKFLERARTEWLSAIGFPLSALESGHNALFVVHRLEIDFRQPARLGDLLAVTFALAERGRSRLIALQDVLRGELLLVRARVTLACLDRRSWRPARIPARLAARINDRVIEEIA
ncbi:MAG TPA: tol-pal system-associated acyl-CoA thioesterase [Casimicrobiaceae bacterium]|nr:tol-pal system-associated acyl-CoA thioesterase [Casimicrobiaceae bacterium]